MSIVKRVKDTTKEIHKGLAGTPEFDRLNDFYKKMKESGIAKKQEYSLPPIDTVGRDLYQKMQCVKG